MECPFGAVGTFASAFEGKCGIRHFLHPLVADTGEPELDRFGLGAGNALDEPQQGFSGRHIGAVTFAVGSRHFQLVTFCDHLTSFDFQTVFQGRPIALCLPVFMLLR